MSNYYKTLPNIQTTKKYGNLLNFIKHKKVQQVSLVSLQKTLVRMFCSILFTICVETFLVRSTDLISSNNVDITVEYELNATDTLTIDVTSDSALLDLVTDGNINTGIPIDSHESTFFWFSFDRKWKVCC